MNDELKQSERDLVASLEADAAFILRCVDEQLSDEQAHAEYTVALERQVSAQPAGVDLLEELRSSSTDGDYVGDARATWQEEIKALEAKGVSRERAVSIVNRKHPGLREAMLQEING